MARIPTIASATVREGYTHPTEVLDVIAQEQVERRQRIEAGRACAPLVQQVLREEAGTGTIVLVGCGGRGSYVARTGSRPILPCLFRYGRIRRFQRKAPLAFGAETHPAGINTRAGRSSQR